MYNPKLKKWNRDSILALANKISGNEVIYSSKHKIVIKVDTHESAVKLGSKDWAICFHRSSEYFDRYIKNPSKIAYFIYNLEETLDSKNSLNLIITGEGTTTGHYADDTHITDINADFI